MKRLFGSSSEKLSPDQLELELEELRELQEALELAETKAELAEEEQKESKRGKRKGLDARIPKDLPTETIIIDPDEVIANPELYKKIGEEHTETLDVSPTRVFKIVVPSALPLIFTGLRLSLGVGWMVLIAAEMLAQNPGLGTVKPQIIGHCVYLLFIGPGGGLIGQPNAI